MNPGDSPGSFADFVAAWDLFRDPVLAAVIAGATLGYLGVFIVLRRMVFVAAALSQAAGLGVAVAFYLQIVFGVSGAFDSPLGCALAFTLATTVALAKPGDGVRLSRESVLGWVYLVGSAGALIVGTRIQQEAHEISSILFGSAVLVTSESLVTLAIVAGIVMTLQLVAARGFRFASFDRDGARVRGLPVGLIDGVLFVSIAIVVSVTTRVLGALPVFAFSVLPAMAAVVVAPSVRIAQGLAALFGAVAGGFGYFCAYRYGLPVGASEAAVAAALVVVTGLVRRAMRTADGRVANAPSGAAAT